MNKNPKSLLEEVEFQNYNTIFVAILIAVLTFVIFYAIYRRSKSVRRSILLMGLSDSGKTLLYTQLLHSKHVATHTSIKENSGDYLVNKKNLKIVDIPGHERLRGKFFDEHKNNAKGIVYVIDSLTLQKEVRDVAEYLYTILTDTVVANNTPNILILCNKQDELLAKGCNVIKSLLEKEMATLRVTQSSQLDSVDSSKTKKIVLGKPDKEFDFAAIPPYTVEFAESQACAASTNIEALKKWLTKVA